jgi:predicted nuclease of predicted toxin-antitoxin system
MKFLVDEQLPESLVKWLETQGFDAVHATSLGTGVRISDTDIAKTSVRESRVVISKDIDFFKRYALLKEPYKLLYLI